MGHVRIAYDNSSFHSSLYLVSSVVSSTYWKMAVRFSFISFKQDLFACLQSVS